MRTHKRATGFLLTELIDETLEILYLFLPLSPFFSMGIFFPIYTESTLYALDLIANHLTHFFYTFQLIIVVCLHGNFRNKCGRIHSNYVQKMWGRWDCNCIDPNVNSKCDQILALKTTEEWRMKMYDKRLERLVTVLKSSIQCFGVQVNCANFLCSFGMLREL